MNDESAIRRALLRYARAVDRLDAELLKSAFWPDAEISLGSIYRGGPEGFAEVAMQFMGMFAATRHDVGNILIEVDGDQAGYEAYVRTWHLTADRAGELVVLGRYIGRAERRAGEWRLIAHGELMDWGEERAVDSRWFDANSELEKGRRDSEDASYRWLAART